MAEDTAQRAVGTGSGAAADKAAAPAPPAPASVAVYERALQRERAARERAESLLESKSRELYQLNQQLREQHTRIQSRNEALEKAHAELQQAQARLIQSEKLASVGQLAAGVAHEINNPMAFIISNLGTLKRYGEALAEVVQGYQAFAKGFERGEPDAAQLAQVRRLEQRHEVDYTLDDLRDLIGESLDGAGRVRDIVQGLKSFSRVDHAVWADADLHAGLESTLKVVGNELKYSCTVVRRFGELPLVPCNLAKLNQVFMNLLVNAAQAMRPSGTPDGGSAPGTPGTLTITTWADTQWARVEIRDTGCGIPPEQLGSIFDPFYTTKPVGSGTGLGLSISYGIVEEHGGRILVDSTVGVGTAFTVQLPLQAAQATPG